MRSFIFSTFCSLMFVVMLFSCKPQVPSQFLQPDEMEDILYDYHIAMGMIDEPDSNDYQKRLTEVSVLNKYGVTEAEFDSSLVYYTRHADSFQKIYENLSKRLNDEAVSLGASAIDVEHFGENAASGDTTNVWKGVSSYVLSTIVPYNVESFYLKADTSYRSGDRIILSFNTQFLFQDGYKDGVAMLAVRYSNDSVASQTIHVSESRRYDLTVSNDKMLDIKDIRGFFCLQNPAESSQSTLKLLFVTDIRLVRYHVSDKVPIKENADVPTADSIALPEKNTIVEPNMEKMQPVGSGMH